MHDERYICNFDFIIENSYYSEHRISNDDTIYTYDGLDNVNMTLSTTGSILQKYEYSDYGERSLDSKTEIMNNEFGYNGEVHTVDGLQYLRTRVDAIGLDTNGNVVIDEYKSSLTAPLTDNQKISFPEIFESGATVVGKGKGIFSGGYQIPSGTKVTIIRPK